MVKFHKDTHYNGIFTSVLRRFSRALVSTSSVSMETCLGNIRRCIKIIMMVFDSNMFKCILYKKQSNLPKITELQQ